MLPPRRQQHSEEGTDSWLMSYADMITLLMCFFIIFISVSEPKKDKLSALTRGLADKFGVVGFSTPFQSIVSNMQGIVEDNKMYKDIAVEANTTGIQMEISTLKFFKQDGVELDGSNSAVLVEIAQALKKLDFSQYRLSVEGHTDNTIPHSEIYPSNWELSSAQAARMVRFLVEQGIKPNQVEVVGRGDSQPIVPNEDGMGKPIAENQARNQRLVIKVEKAY